MIATMNTRSVSVLLALFLLAACKSPNGEPNLDEAQAWMHSFVADRGAGATYEGSSCSGSITWLDGGNPSYTFSFSLGDLDPSSAKSQHTVVSPPAMQNMWRAAR